MLRVLLRSEGVVVHLRRSALFYFFVLNNLRNLAHGTKQGYIAGEQQIKIQIKSPVVVDLVRVLLRRITRSIASCHALNAEKEQGEGEGEGKGSEPYAACALVLFFTNLSDTPFCLVYNHSIDFP